MKQLFVLFLLPVLLLAQDHLLISEVMIPPDSETDIAFIEIYNPTGQTVALDDYYLSNYNTYYQIVQNQFSQEAIHFLSRFPQAEINAGQTIVVALYGQSFADRFGKQADFEVVSTDDAVPDMTSLYLGASPKLEFTRGMVILFKWNGQSDLVQDVDYFPWGLAPFHTYWMDKTGVSIDGPDGDGDVSAYLDDLPTAQQKARQAPTGDLSPQRKGITEVSEVSSNGNGLSGHNEASEDWQTSFADATPTPGSFSETAGDGSGTATIHPDTVETNSSHNFEITLTGSAEYTLTSVQIVVPAAFNWSRNESDVVLQGSGLSGAALSVNGDTITISNAAVTNTDIAVCSINSVTVPADEGLYSFRIKTAVTGGTLTPIGIFPAVVVKKKLTIREILENFSEYNGQQVTLEAVVTIGAGITRTDRTDAYIQDESGRGINLSDAGTDFPDLVRGNRIRITGQVSEYRGDPQIQNFTTEVISTGNEVPGVQLMSIGQASDLSLKGTMIETAGIIRSIFTFTDGNSNITIDDGTASIVIRVWQTTGIDVTVFSEGDTIGVRAVIDEFSSAAQLLVGYQDDLFPTRLKEFAAGSGSVSVTPDSVGKDEDVTLEFAFTATSEDTVQRIAIDIPSYWGWSENPADINLGGDLVSADVSVTGNQIVISQANLVKPAQGGIIVGGLHTPAADTASVFRIWSGEAAGPLSEIKISPVLLVGTGTGVPTIPIAEARKLDPGTRVSLRGTVVIGSGILRSGQTSAYMQDGSGRGINIFDRREDADIKRGNYIVISGLLTEYVSGNNDRVLELTGYTVRVLKTNSTLPKPLEFSPFEAQKLDPAEYEGTWIQVEGRIANVTSDDYGSNLYVSDNADQVTVRINRDTGLKTDGFRKGDYIRVRGVVGTYRGDIQILPGYQEDLEVFDPSLKPGYYEVKLNLPPRPFVPEKGEKLPIDYTVKNSNSHITIRIFDLGGRLVTTLFDGAPYDVEINWNGRDALNELVPIGTYICHLEAVDNDTGERQIKTAPIVVGTVLR